MNPEEKSILDQLSSRLIEFHKQLLQHQTAVVESRDGRKYGPYELLGMSLNDPRFAWLRPLSKLIARIDAYTAGDDEDEPLDVRKVADEVDALLGGGSAEFSPRYSEALADAPQLKYDESAVRRAASALKLFLKPT